MEDVLDLYAQPVDEKRPLVCFDERLCQLIADIHPGLPMKPKRGEKPGHPSRYDYEYERQGSCNLFAFFAPYLGWRHMKVTERRTKVDFARCMKELVDIYFPEAEVIKLVMDNLNIHTPAALYEVFEPEEARRIINKLEIHYTPKHGSWLNMVEGELSVLVRQCLKQRIPNQEILQQEVAAWETERNQQKVQVNWRFRPEDARIKLKRLYPSELMT
jgi:transposase